MIYLLGSIIPMALQSLIVLIVIQVNTGNGSWLGLGAFLIGMFAIPATGIINALYIKSHKDFSSVHILTRCALITAITPFIILLFMFIG